MDLDAYTDAHSADWDRLSRLAKQRRLDGRDADELIDLHNRVLSLILAGP